MIEMRQLDFWILCTCCDRWGDDEQGGKQWRSQ
jgi:hypothetical protein